MARRALDWHRLNPVEIIVFSFASTIALGTGLLMLPGATHQGMRWVDALFTATSAVCVTGLTVVDTGTYFTGWGQGIILCLIQVGGLGMVTLSALVFYLLTGGMSLRDREAILMTVAGTRTVHLGELLKAILLLTLGLELLGALLLALDFARTYPWGQALYAGLFHSVAAFCNAGFSLFSDSLVRYRADPLVNLTVMLLIITGGLGFSVLLELRYVVGGKRGLRKLSLHTRLVLIVTATLILSGAVLFFAVERDSVLRGLPWHTQVLASFFQSVTTRTAGFNTVEIGQLADITLFAMILLMFVGAGSGSCAGGIKVSSLGIMVAQAWNRLMRGSSHVNLFGRRIPEATVDRGFSVGILAFILINVVLMVMLTTETVEQHAHPDSGGAFIELAFEVTSAFGTVGLSTGITPELTTAGRLLITVVMFVGRVGPLTLVALLSRRKRTAFRYPEEDVLVG